MAYRADEFTGRCLGKYEVLCRIAVGGMAEIFLGFARSGPAPNQMVVLKRILADQRGDRDALPLLIDEAKVCAMLNHPNVGRVLDLERADEEVLLAMEFIRGATLDELSTLHLQHGERLPLGFVLTAIRDAALGLSHAHTYVDSAHQPAPIIHRDVTPRNLMVGFDGLGRVLDFGIARRLGAARRTVAGMVRGTAAYMAPEQATDREMDTRADLFSLGIVFHEMLTGRRLFYKGNPALDMAAVYEAPIPAPSQVQRGLSKALDEVVLKALTRNVAQRYQTAHELIADLEKVAAGQFWSRQRAAALVCDAFADRQREIFALEARVARRESTPLSTVAGWPVFKVLEGEGPFSGSWKGPPALKAASEPPAATRPSVDRTQPNEPMPPTTRRFRRGSLWLGAIAAIGAGAMTAVAVYRWKAAEADIASGVSIVAPRPLEVRYGSQRLGVTPLNALSLPAGRQRLEVREGDGPWRSMEIEVPAQGAIQVDVVLDSAP
ncbi:MAG: serine/threonine protein kinase [Myxococcaceae bacterium]|nr:serine/threonine protein kinase [Myxococcaceae bacterium]